MVIINKRRSSKVSREDEQKWDNPKDPENTEDQRDLEQMQRQKEEAERRNKNLSDNPKKSKK